LTGIFFFGLPILDRIESPTAAGILRLYSDNGIDLHRSSPPTARHGRLRRTWGVPTYVAADCSRSRGLLHRSIFVLIVRDFTDNVAINSDLRIVIRAHGMTCASISLINRSSARLRQSRPRARAYRRPSIGLPLRCPFRPQRRYVWSKPPASNTPSKARM
jgi:hypothetical protein